MEIREKIVKTALSFVGQEEVRGNLGFKDSRFEELMKSVGWQKTQAWCVYFAELVWKVSYTGNQKIVAELNKLFSGSAVQTWKNFLSADGWTISSTPVLGSLVIWQNYKEGIAQWSGHAAINTKIGDSRFQTVEGNTNDAGGREGYIVAIKDRPYSFSVENGLQLLGFVYPKSI